MRVYVAGLYSRTPDGKVAGIIDALHNMQVGMRVATELLIAGHVPFCPWLDYQFFLMLREGETIPMDAIKAYSMEWLKVSEAILMLPGWEGSAFAPPEPSQPGSIRIASLTLSHSMLHALIASIGIVSPSRSIRKNW